MTVEQTKVIDFIGTDRATGKVHLTVSDHLRWDSENRHLLLLQEKLNAYLAFIENNAVFESYPEAKGRDFIIDVKLKHRPTGVGVRFLEQARQKIENAGIGFIFGSLGSGYDDDNSLPQ